METPKPGIKNTLTLRYLFKRDNLLATIMVFLLIGLFARIEAVSSIFDPQEISTKDFSFTDLAYNLLGKPANLSPIDTGIVIVNIGDSPRDTIAAIIKKIAAYQPKVVGVDVVFAGAKSPAADTALRNIALNYKNVVMSYMIDTAGQPVSYLYGTGQQQGFVNFTSDNQNVIRDFEPFLNAGDQKKYTSLAAVIAQKADEGAYDTLVAKHGSKQIINYQYTENNYVIINSADVLSANFSGSSVKNKIVLLGYISRDAADCSDKHFTPMNSKIAGKSLPDMNGVVIHANIIRMMLDHSYIYVLPAWLTWILAFVICWIHMAFFIGYFIERHIWFHLAAKIAQLISAVFFVYLGLFLFFKFRIAIDLTDTIFAIVLAVDVLYFYEAAVLWLHQRKGYKTLFHHEGHS